jgi:RNA polymerase sigma-70 factor, ECF subfamily
MRKLQEGAVEVATASTHSDSPSPEDLARRAQSGCVTSYTELSRRFRPRLLHVLQRRLGNRFEDAEDVTQEALARAWQCLGTYDGRSRFSTWLFTIALRLATDHHRRTNRRPIRVADGDAARSPETPEDLVLRRELTDNLWRIAGFVLTGPQYTALWLRYGEDLSVGEVAQVVGKSAIGTRVLLHRARALLRPHAARLIHDEGEVQ